MSNSEWLFYQIYPGSIEAMDTTVLQVVEPALRAAETLGGLQGWFFLRYLDERGLHIRLRFNGSATFVDTLQARMESLLPQSLHAIASQALPPVQRLIPMPQHHSLERGHVGYELALYEPEYEKYGGAEGVSIAEELFERSSRIALRTLPLVSESMARRGIFALALMTAAVEVAIPEPERTNFWAYYSRYWAGGDTAGATALEICLRTAAQKRIGFVQRLWADLQADDRLCADVADFRLAVRNALAKALAAGVAPTPSMLCFHYVHLMNNRLGILPLEEAYLALLIQGLPTGQVSSA